MTSNGPLMAHGRMRVPCSTATGRKISPVTRPFAMERVTGIEPAWPAWKAGALPLSYTRRFRRRVEHQFSTWLRSRGDRTRTCDLLLPKQTR